jgi:hypothetical protein
MTVTVGGLDEQWRFGRLTNAEASVFAPGDSHPLGHFGGHPSPGLLLVLGEVCAEALGRMRDQVGPEDLLLLPAPDFTAHLAMSVAKED